VINDGNTASASFDIFQTASAAHGCSQRSGPFTRRDREHNATVLHPISCNEHSRPAVGVSQSATGAGVGFGRPKVSLTGVPGPDVRWFTYSKARQVSLCSYMRRYRRLKQGAWFTLGWAAVSTYMHLAHGESTLPAIAGGGLAAATGILVAAYFSRNRSAID